MVLFVTTNIIPIDCCRLENLEKQKSTIRRNIRSISNPLYEIFYAETCPKSIVLILPLV